MYLANCILKLVDPRRGIFIVPKGRCILSILCFFFLGCSSILPKAGVIPPPQPGMVIVANSNEGAWANISVFRGYLSMDDIFMVDPKTGGAMLSQAPIDKFTIPSPPGKDFHTVKTLLLTPKADYTFLIVWTRVTGAVLDVHTLHVRTTGNPFNESHTDPLGRKTFADRFMKLPWVNTSGSTQLRIHKTIYPGQIIKDLLGLP